MKLITMKINENSILKYRFLSPIVCFALIVSVVALRAHGARRIG